MYQPIESLFLLLITNKASNIVEDLETLRLLSKGASTRPVRPPRAFLWSVGGGRRLVILHACYPPTQLPSQTQSGPCNAPHRTAITTVVPEVAGGVTEDRVSDAAFELVFAFDEVITTGGYREAVNLQQIKTNMEMDSHEEKLALMIKQSKMDSAKDQAARQAKAIRERQRELVRGGCEIAGAWSGINNTTYVTIVHVPHALILPTPPLPGRAGASGAPQAVQRGAGRGAYQGIGGGGDYLGAGGYDGGGGCEYPASLAS